MLMAAATWIAVLMTVILLMLTKIMKHKIKTRKMMIIIIMQIHDYDDGHDGEEASVHHHDDGDAKGCATAV